MQIIFAFRYALAGIIYCIRRERNLKIHLAAAFAVLGLAWHYGVTSIELGLLSLTIAGVITAELFNTALEILVDKISPDYHPAAKAVKDAAAGAVLIQAMASLVVGYILFWNKMLG
jgi:undecaprenol kinase/diacylglycerol kinase (ATP)